MKLGITGGTGLIGSLLAAAAVKKGHEVVVFGRGEASAVGENIKYVSMPVPKASLLEGLDTIVNLAGAPFAGLRWSPALKKRIISSRVDFTMQLSNAVREAKNGPGHLVQGSAIGYYGSYPDGSENFTENSPSGSDFLAKVCVDWENAALLAGVPTAMIRTGVVLAREGGALPLMALPIKLFIGGKIGDGKQILSWIHVDDMVNGLLHVIENKKTGIFNFTAPKPVSNSEITREIAKIVHRPAIFTVPGFIMTLIFGEGGNIVLKGQKVSPQALEKSGFHFKYTDISSALADLL